MLDSTAYPHIIDRIVDLAPFSVRLELRLVSKKVCARVDQLLWRHIAYGQSKYKYELEFCEPFPPWNRLPAYPLGAIFHPKKSTDEAELPWRRARIVDCYGVPDSFNFDFGEATVRSIRPAAGFFSCGSLVDYFALSPTYRRSLSPIDLPRSKLKRYVLRALVDLRVYQSPGIDPHAFDLKPAHQALSKAREGLNSIETVDIVLDVIGQHSTLSTATTLQHGLLDGLEWITAIALEDGKHVTIAGLELIPPSIMGLPDTATIEQVHDKAIDAIRHAINDRAERPAPLLSMQNLTICSFGEWAAAADPAERCLPLFGTKSLGYEYDHWAPVGSNPYFEYESSDDSDRYDHYSDDNSEHGDPCFWNGDDYYDGFSGD